MEYPRLDLYRYASGITANFHCIKLEEMGLKKLLEKEAYEGELNELRNLRALIKHTVLAEKVGGIYFICGELGEKDVNNMPQKIMVCPAYGVDFSYVYEYTGVTTGPEW